MESLTCHECGGAMNRAVRPDTIYYKGRTVNVDQPGWYCESCDEAVLSGHDMKATEPAYLELRAETEGVLSPKEIATIRHKLQLTQRQASELFGGGTNAFQKYESGEVMPSAAMSNLLKICSELPGASAVLRSVQ